MGLSQGSWNRDGSLDNAELRRFGFTNNFIPWNRVCKSFRCLRVGFGATLLEANLTLVFLTCLYVQQLFVVTFALKTDVLLVARDVCTMWRWQHLSPSISLFLEQISERLALVDLKAAIERSVADLRSKAERNGVHPCVANGDHFRMTWADRLEMTESHPRVIYFGTAVILLLLFGPMVHWIIYGRLAIQLRKKGDARLPSTTTEDGDDSGEIARVKDELDAVKNEHAREMAELRAQIAQLRQ